MNTALHRLLLLLLLALPWAAQAGDAADYAKASPAKQARLLESWAAAPAPERLELIEALRANRVAIDQNKTPFIEENGTYRALAGDAEPVGTPKKLRLNNRLRGLLNTALASHQLSAEDPAQRLAAAKRLQRSGQPEQLELLQQRLDAEDDAAVSEALTLALANLQLTASDPAVRLAAVRLLGETGAPMARVRLENLLADEAETDANVRKAAETSLAQVKRKLLIGELLGQAFSGLSLGSILLLAALGLAITFGLLGVINMAHGEMLMLGAYTTYMVQVLMARLAPEALALYPLVALPVAFFVTAAIGMALERTVIRHLYGRPLETLLATWGISLILIQ
ncbi:MAG: urea ABC transporter permease subunit UrtB, partial [Gammaproteobacteria bacterium HGW-Gammaproteobacteria-9]